MKPFSPTGSVFMTHVGKIWENEVILLDFATIWRKKSSGSVSWVASQAFFSGKVTPGCLGAQALLFLFWAKRPTGGVGGSGTRRAPENF